MFSDTHFHFRHLVRDRALDGAAILSGLCARETFFALDIGTEADDLIERLNFVEEAASALSDGERERVRSLVKFSAGIWPSVEEISARHERMGILEDKIAKFSAADGKRLVAIGECGLDHHWNPAGADGRSADDFDSEMLLGEEELFEMQLQLASRLDLPVIVHSREAFDGTVSVLRNMDSHRGIIHCYSYGIDEARVFLDLGYHIAFGGAVTYAKKSRIEEMAALLRFVPDDRILIETDSPYLAPVPFRGQVNTPILVEYVYNFVASARSVTPSALSAIVDGNISKLFRL